MFAKSLHKMNVRLAMPLDHRLESDSLVRCEPFIKELHVPKQSDLVTALRIRLFLSINRFKKEAFLVT